MGDATADYRYEWMRLEAQAKNIRITVLDQKVQLAEFVGERAELKEEQKRLRSELPEVPEDGDELETLRGQLARDRAELAIFNIDLRLAELDGIESRHRENIAASDSALAELDQQIAALKEAHGG